MAGCGEMIGIGRRCPVTKGGIWPPRVVIGDPRPNFADDWRDVPGKAISISLHAGNGTTANICQVRITEDDTAGPGGLKRVFCALCNHLSFLAVPLHASAELKLT